MHDFVTVAKPKIQRSKLPQVYSLDAMKISIYKLNSEPIRQYPCIVIKLFFTSYGYNSILSAKSPNLYM